MATLKYTNLSFQKGKTLRKKVRTHFFKDLSQKSDFFLKILRKMS